MIKNPGLLKKFQDDFIRDKGKLPFQDSIKLFSDMWNEGLRLGVLPLKEPLDGIDVDIKIARVLNSCLKKPSPR